MSSADFFASIFTHEPLVEELKHHSKEFGGRQHKTLNMEEIAQRLCIVAGCGARAWAQSAIMDAERSEHLRLFVVCKEHLLAITMSVLYGLGHPTANDYGRALAEQIGVDWNLYLHESVELCTPEDWRCAYCNGQMAPETVGMFKGQRWIHTCGITVREATTLAPDLLDKFVMPFKNPTMDEPLLDISKEAPNTMTEEPVRTAYCDEGCSETHTYGTGCALMKREERPDA